MITSITITILLIIIVVLTLKYSDERYSRKFFQNANKYWQKRMYDIHTKNQAMSEQLEEIKKSLEKICL